MKTDHTATTTTLAARTRVRIGTRMSDVVMVLFRYSVVMQRTPRMGARTCMVP